MKQIALVLFVTALAVVGYVVTGKLTRPDSAANRVSGSLPNVPAAKSPTDVNLPVTQRPSLGGEDSKVIYSDELKAKLAARANFDWKAVADPASVVRMDQAWSFDLDGVDFDADVLLHIDGRPVTRERFRAFAILQLAGPLVEARLNRELTLHRAAQRGIDVSISDSEYERLFDISAASKGMTPDQLNQQLALTSGFSPSVTYEMRRWAFEGGLANAAGVEGMDNMPALFRANMADGDPRVVADQSLSTINEGWQAVLAARARGEAPDEESMRQVATGLDSLSLFSMGALMDEMAYRVWTFLDDPDAAQDLVAGISLAELPEGNLAAPDSTLIPPPWQAPGPRATVQTGQLWDLISPGLRPYALQSALEQYIYYEALAAELRTIGEAVTPLESWEAFLAEYAATKQTALGMGFLHVQLEGYPSLHHFRAQTAIQAGFERTLPPDWDSDAKLENFYGRNRFFIEGWQPTLTMAFFPAVAPSDAQGRPDWERSLAQAKTMQAKAAEGEDFTALARSQNSQLVQDVRDRMGEAAATQLESQIGPGAQDYLGMAQIDELVSLKLYDQLLRGTSVARSAAAHLEPAEVSQPWRTPLGYVLVRVDGARLGELEREYEDVQFQTQYFYRNSRYENWLNDVLRKVEIAID